MDFVTLGTTLMFSSLCEAKASLSLLFGLAVSVSTLLSELLFWSIRLCSTLKVQVATKILVSVSAAVMFSRLTGVIFSGDVDTSFYAVCGAASAMLSTLKIGRETPRFFSTLLLCCTVIPSSFTIGVIRELIGYGTIWGKNVSFISDFTVGSLRSYFGGLLIASAVTAVVFLIKGRDSRKNGA